MSYIGMLKKGLSLPMFSWLTLFYCNNVCFTNLMFVLWNILLVITGPEFKITIIGQFTCILPICWSDHSCICVDIMSDISNNLPAGSAVPNI